MSELEQQQRPQTTTKAKVVAPQESTTTTESTQVRERREVGGFVQKSDKLVPKDLATARETVRKQVAAGQLDDAGLAAILSIVTYHKSVFAAAAYLEDASYTEEQEAFWRIRIFNSPLALQQGLDQACGRLWATTLQSVVDTAEPVAKLTAERAAGRGGSAKAISALGAIAFERAAGEIADGAGSALPLKKDALKESPIDLARAEARIQTGSAKSDIEAIQILLALDASARLAHEALFKKLGWREAVVPTMKRFAAVLAQPARTIDLLHAIRKYREAGAQITPKSVQLLAEALQLFNRDPRRVEAALAAPENTVLLDVATEVEVAMPYRAAYVAAMRLLEPKTRTTGGTTQGKATTGGKTTDPGPKVSQLSAGSDQAEKGYTPYSRFKVDKLTEGQKNRELMRTALIQIGKLDPRIAQWMATYSGSEDPLADSSDKSAEQTPYKWTEGGYQNVAIRNDDGTMMSEEQIDEATADGVIELRLATRVIEWGKKLSALNPDKLEAWIKVDLVTNQFQARLDELKAQLAAKPEDESLKQQVEQMENLVREGRQQAKGIRSGGIDPATAVASIDREVSTLNGYQRDARALQAKFEKKMAEANAKIIEPDMSGMDGNAIGGLAEYYNAKTQYDQATSYLIAVQNEKERLLWRQSVGLPLDGAHLKFRDQLITVNENTTGEFRPQSGYEGVGRTVLASLNGLVAMGARVTGSILRDVPGSEVLLGGVPGIGVMRQQIGQNMIDWSKDADKWSEREKMFASRSIGETGVAITDFVTSTAVMMIVTMGIGSLAGAAGRLVFVGGRWIMAGSRAATAVELASSSLALGTVGFFDAADKSWDERLLNGTAMALGPLFGNKGGALRKMAVGFISNMAIDAGQLSYKDVFKYYVTTGDAKGAGEAAYRLIEQNKERLFMSGLMGLTAGFSKTPKERAKIEVDGKFYEWSFTGRDVVESKIQAAGKDTIKLSRSELAELQRVQSVSDFQAGEAIVSRAESRADQIALGDQTLGAVNTEVTRLSADKQPKDNGSALTAAKEEKAKLEAQQQVTRKTVDGSPIPKTTMEAASMEIPPGYRLEGDMYRQNPEAFKADNAKLATRAATLAIVAKEYQAAVKQMDGATTDLLVSKTDASRNTNRTKLDEQTAVAKQKLAETKLDDAELITVDTEITKTGAMIENGFQVGENKVPLEGPNGWLLDKHGKEVDSKGRRRDAEDRILAVDDKGEVVPNRFLDNEGRLIDANHKFIDETGKLLTDDELEARYPELSSKPANGKLENGTEVGMSGKELSGASGGTADVWEGWIGDQQVVVKALRASNSEVDTRAAFAEAKDLHERLGGAQPIGIATFDRGGKKWWALVLERVGSKNEKGQFEAGCDLARVLNGADSEFPVTQKHVEALAKLRDRAADLKLKLDDVNEGDFILTRDGRVVPIDLGITTRPKPTKNAALDKLVDRLQALVVLRETAPVMTKTDSPFAWLKTFFAERTTMKNDKLVDELAHAVEESSHNAGSGSVGSCTYAALLATIAAAQKGWKSEIIIIDGLATSASSDASLGTTGTGAGTTKFAHAIARIELPDGTEYFVTWGKKFSSLDAAVQSNAAITSYTQRGRYTAYEETMALLNDNGYIRPEKQKSQVGPGGNTTFDANPNFTPERTPWHFPGLEQVDANALAQYATSLQMTNPKLVTMEAFTPAGLGLSKYLEPLKINGVEQYFQGKQIITRYRATIIEATSASGVTLYFARSSNGTITMWPTLEKATLASRLGDRKSWPIDSRTVGATNDGTVDAYRLHQETVNTPSKQ